MNIESYVKQTEISWSDYFSGNPEQIPPNANKTSPTSSFSFPEKNVVYKGPT